MSPQVQACITKKIDATNVDNKVTKEKNLRSRIAHRRCGLRYKKHRRYKREQQSHKKEKPAVANCSPQV
ncbi:hypothetical protein CLOSTMETH_03937 [[Clostridium] methylpentosum DSM 5476]|uniref:Uncharacterized protein n=1 Tax=[Clostridium] methylpentosum DSM 5476 TaxID=537013 RepID=C0EJ84_9FIRM|nr:hypothetical protein CLOSTMETH_03937 [[Clostridium] methylpentosum DSM 5476]